MPTIKHRPFPGSLDDEELLRRLGAAVAIHWDMIGLEANQLALISQAAMLGDSDESAATLRKQIAAFIDAHKEGA